jgi:hypothetical protein
MGWRAGMLGLTAACLGLAPIAAHAEGLQRVDLRLPGLDGNETNAKTRGWMAVTLKQSPAGGTLQVDTTLYPSLNGLKAGRKWEEATLLVTTPATTTNYVMHNVQVTDIGIDAPDVAVTFSYGSISTSSAKTPPGTF